MLPKTRRLWSRCGLMALTIPITLSMTGAASAAVNDNSPAQTQTYDNLAQASSQTDRWTDFSVKYQLEQTSAETVNGDNSAVASTSYCHDCGAVAIGFQVLVISKQDLANLHVSNTADAASYACTRCDTLAAAYQIVFATNSPQLTFDQILGLAGIEQKLDALKTSGLSTARMQQLAGEFAQQAVFILQGGIGTYRDGNAPAYSPALHGAGLPANMAENSGPVTDLYVKYKNG
jgi:hypothetical protein